MGMTFRFCSLGSYGDGTWYVDRFSPLPQIYNQFFNIKNCFTNLCIVTDPSIPNKIVTTSRSTPFFTISQTLYPITTTTRSTTTYRTYPYNNNQNINGNNYFLNLTILTIFILFI